MMKQKCILRPGSVASNYVTNDDMWIVVGNWCSNDNRSEMYPFDLFVVVLDQFHDQYKLSTKYSFINT